MRESNSDLSDINAQCPIPAVRLALGLWIDDLSTYCSWRVLNSLWPACRERRGGGR